MDRFRACDLCFRRIGLSLCRERHEREIEEETLVKVPANLDLTPYRDEKDFALLERLVRKERAER